MFPECHPLAGANSQCSLLQKMKMLEDFGCVSLWNIVTVKIDTCTVTINVLHLIDEVWETHRT